MLRTAKIFLLWFEGKATHPCEVLEDLRQPLLAFVDIEIGPVQKLLLDLQREKVEVPRKTSVFVCSS